MPINGAHNSLNFSLVFG